MKYSNIPFSQVYIIFIHTILYDVNENIVCTFLAAPEIKLKAYTDTGCVS